MKKLEVLILLAFIAVVSCKKDGTPVRENSNKEIEIPVKGTSNKKKETPSYAEAFTITLDAKITKDDNFQVFYLEQGDKAFSEAKSKWLKIDGNENIQKVSFIIPKNIIPVSLRLDLGRNINQKLIYIEGITFSHKANSFYISNSEILEYFTPNGCVSVNDNSEFLLSEVMNGEKVFYAPLCMPKEDLLLELKALQE